MTVNARMLSKVRAAALAVPLVLVAFSMGQVSDPPMPADGAGAVLWEVGQPQADENPIPHHCTGDYLINKTSCAAPDRCPNACAYHCTSGQDCRACCQHFFDAQYDACKGRCKDVFNPEAPTP